MELKGPDFSKNRMSDYTETNYKSYKARLAKALVTDGVSTDMFLEEKYSNLRQYIIQYVQEVLINNKAKDALNGITYKLANTTIQGESTGVATDRTYPVINRYQGHLIEETLYFRLRPDGTVDIQHIPYAESTIIIN